MTLDDLLRSRRIVLRHTEIGRQSRKAGRSIILMALMSLALGLAMLTLRGLSLLMGAGLVAVGVLLLALPVISRRQAAKNFAAHPHKNEDQIWQIFPDKILGAAGEETPWSLVVQVVGTSDGFLLCRRDKPFIWLPLRAFINKEEIEEFSRIARGQVEQYESEV